MSESCATCVFKKDHQCRRYPPQMVNYAPDNQNPTIRWPCPWWPEVRPEDWCGEYRQALE